MVASSAIGPRLDSESIETCEPSSDAGCGAFVSTRKGLIYVHAVPIEPLVFVGYSLVAVALVIELVLALVSFYRASRGNGDR